VLLAALGRPVHDEEIQRISPWRYAAPLSPDMAARLEGRPLDFDALVAYCAKAIEQNRGTLLIEGIGGVMVPLDHRHTVLDWMSALNIPAILIAGSYLGTLSHTLTALDAVGRRQVAIKAVVVNETPASTVPLADTASNLARFSGAVPVVTLPRLAAAETAHPALGELARLL
jgi:dethiobiotin synthetase